MASEFTVSSLLALMGMMIESLKRPSDLPKKCALKVLAFIIPHRCPVLLSMSLWKGMVA